MKLLMCTRAKSKTEREKKGGGRGDMSEALCEVMRSISRSPLPENLEAELGIYLFMHPVGPVLQKAPVWALCRQ